MANNHPRAKAPRSWLKRLLTVLAVLLILTGLGLIAGTLFFPDEAEKVAGEVRIATTQTIQKAKGQEHPVIRLGVKGGKRELDRCDGSFIEMASYETEGLQPVYAAHNVCKGEVVLPLEMGELVEVKGHGLHVITDIRYTKKTWSTTNDIMDMTGDFIVQSCFYGENRMKFIGLTPVGAEAYTSAPTPSAD